MNYVAPRADNPIGTDEEVGVDTAEKSALLEATAAVNQKFTQGNPVAAKALAQLEAESVETGKSPKQLKSRRTADDERRQARSPRISTTSRRRRLRRPSS